MKTFRTAVFIALAANVIMVQAAPVSMADLPYYCDFEQEAENTNWILNPSVETIITDNRWVIGSAQSYAGGKSLYVSQDNGATNTYASTNNVLLAYRDVSLDAGEYDIAYDWRGTGDNSGGHVKVVFANRPGSSLTCIGNSVEPAWAGAAVPMTFEADTPPITTRQKSIPNNLPAGRHDLWPKNRTCRQNRFGTFG